MLFVYEPNGRWGLAKWRYVNLGEENGTQVEILSEGPEEGTVERGEIVLVDGHHYLAHELTRKLHLMFRCPPLSGRSNAGVARARRAHPPQ